MGSSSNMCDLPEDMVAEVLVRVDVEMVLRLRSVSKSWKTLIDSPKFKHKHKQYGAGITQLVYMTREQNLYMTRCMDRSVIKIDIEIEQEKKECMVLIGSCNGFLCLVKVYPRRCEYSVVVMNPCTKQTFEALPRAIDYKAIGFGHDSVNDDYKVVKFDGKPSLCNFQVYSFRSKCWRDILQPPNHKYEPLEFGAHIKRRGIFVNGALHWITFDNDIDEYAILAFDLATEKFRIVPLHEEVNATFTDDVPWLNLGDVDGYLSLFIGAGYGLNVWMMKEYGVLNSWMRVKCEVDESMYNTWYENFDARSFLKLGILNIDTYLAYWTREDHVKRHKNENKVDDLLHLKPIGHFMIILTLTPTLDNLPAQN